MELIEPEKYDPHKEPEVRKSLRLIDTRMDMPPMAYRLFSFAASRLRGKHLGERTVAFDARELAAMIGTTSNNFAKELRAAATRLVTIPVEIPEWDRGGVETSWTVMPLVQKVKYQKGSSHVSVTFDEVIVPHLVNLNNFFAKLELRTLMQFRGTYSTRFYEFARSREGDTDAAGNVKPWEISLQELRATLGIREREIKDKQIKEKQYPRFVDFQRRVLFPAERELARFAKILLTHEPRRKGRAVVALRFTVSRMHPAPPAPAALASPAPTAPSSPSAYVEPPNPERLAQFERDRAKFKKEKENHL